MKTMPQTHTTHHLATLFVALFTVAVTVLGCSKAAHYRAHHDRESLFAVLHQEVKPGDSIERIQKLLGEGQPPQNPERRLARSKKYAQVEPRAFPAGVLDDDKFLEYSSGNLFVVLQFREGRLVNFDPKEYEKLPLGNIAGPPQTNRPSKTSPH